MSVILEAMEKFKIGVIPLPGGTWGAKAEIGAKGYGDTIEKAVEAVLAQLRADS